VRGLPIPSISIPPDLTFPPMNSTLVATLTYGCLSLLGGLYGYLKAQSKVSLISGLVSGGLLLGSALAQALNYPWGKPLALGLTVVLVITFALRLKKTGKWMPAGVMVTLGCGAILIMVGT